MRQVDFHRLHMRLNAALERFELAGDYRRVALILELWWLWAERTSGVAGGPAYLI